jgi:hypothetical protein
MTDADIIGTLCCQLTVTAQQGESATVYHLIGYHKHDPSEWDVIASFRSLDEATSAKANMEAQMATRIRFASAKFTTVQ